MLASRVAMMQSVMPEDRGVAGEGAAGGDPDHRDGAADPGHHVVGGDPLTGGGDVAEVGVAGASACAFSPDDQRRGLFVGELDHPIGLLVTHHALGAGPDRLVVHRDQGGRAVLVEEVAVDRADAGDHAVGGGADAHLLDRHDPVAGGQDQLAHLDPTALIDQLGQALALGQLALGVAAVDPGLAVLVLAGGELVEQLLQVGTDVVEIDLGLLFADRVADIRWLR